jgi:hypothetical protein
MKGASKISPVQLRLPDDLKQWLKHKAVDNMRSLNSELVARLQNERQREEHPSEMNVHYSVTLPQKKGGV